MRKIAVAVTRVEEIVSEIANAGNEQAAGVQQVNQAISHMDQVTQQNASLVEEAAAAAASLHEQAMRLSQAVSLFNLGRESRFISS